MRLLSDDTIIETTISAREVAVCHFPAASRISNSAVRSNRCFSFYFGGRVQTFQLGEIKGKHTFIDINSAYPFAMLSRHPYGSKYLEKLKIPDHNHGGYFAKIKAISHGALPSRDETGKLQFYNDDIIREYWCTGWEIQAGLETNTLDSGRSRSGPSAP